MDPEIVVTDVIESGVEEVIGGGLNGFNDVMVGYADRRSLAVLVRDPGTGFVLGGALGRTSLGLLFLELFYLPMSLRKKGLGSRVLTAFEAEGRARGCANGVLYTVSFQAPGFYEKHGWTRFGEVACAPAGTSRVFMSKAL